MDYSNPIREAEYFTNWVESMDNQGNRLELLETETARELGLTLLKSDPSDYVEFDYESILNMYDMWAERAGKRWGSLPPADIILSETVPITDMVLNIKITDEFMKRVMERSRFKVVNRSTIGAFRVKLFKKEEYFPLLNPDSREVEEVTGTCVGVIAFYVSDFTLFFPIAISVDENSMTFGTSAGFLQYGVVKERKTMSNDMLYYLNTKSDVTVGRTVTAMLNYWYTIQIMLLHPQISKIMASSGARGEVRLERTNPRKPKRRRAVYVRKIYINEKVIDETRKVRKKCPCWRVIGHWRQYKDGKRVWIHPYWKGELRHTKKNYDEIRERGVAVNKKAVENA